LCFLAVLAASAEVARRSGGAAVCWVCRSGRAGESSGKCQWTGGRTQNRAAGAAAGDDCPPTRPALGALAPSRRRLHETPCLDVPSPPPHGRQIPPVGWLHARTADKTMASLESSSAAAATTESGDTAPETAPEQRSASGSCAAPGDASLLAMHIQRTDSLRRPLSPATRRRAGRREACPGSGVKNPPILAPLSTVGSPAPVAVACSSLVRPHSSHQWRLRIPEQSRAPPANTTAARRPTATCGLRRWLDICPAMAVRDADRTHVPHVPGRGAHQCHPRASSLVLRFDPCVLRRRFRSYLRCRCVVARCPPGC